MTSVAVHQGALAHTLAPRSPPLHRRSVYITKQVSFRNRVLILFDWVKAQVFGRDLSNY